MALTTAEKARLAPHVSQGSIPLSLVLTVLPLIDFMLIAASGVFFYIAYVGYREGEFGPYLLAILGLSTGSVLAQRSRGTYGTTMFIESFWQAKGILGVVTIAFGALVVVAFALKASENYSRVWLFSWYLSSIGLLFWRVGLTRLLTYQLASTGRMGRSIVVVGATEQANTFLAQLRRINHPWNVVAGVFDDRIERVGPQFGSYPVLGTTADLMDFVRSHRVDEIIICMPWNAEQRIAGFLDQLRELPVYVRLAADLAGYLPAAPKLTLIGRIPMLDLLNKPIDGWRLIAKLITDKVIGLAVLIACLPLMAVIALAIKLDSPGPILFRQTRYGFNNRPFELLKFRTMRVDQSNDRAVAQATPGDPRVTAVGRILRRWSLDELPQLLNVLSGSMSLVGPRPHALVHNESYARQINAYFARHKVKPGITGWAQVNYLRGETDTIDKMKARVAFDVAYIENWSLLFDLRILIRTILVVLRGENAY
jgi:Undecaprenyl-phosphate glucose phosphotransferase